MLAKNEHGAEAFSWDYVRSGVDSSSFTAYDIGVGQDGSMWTISSGYYTVVAQNYGSWRENEKDGENDIKYRGNVNVSRKGY